MLICFVLVRVGIVSVCLGSSYRSARKSLLGRRRSSVGRRLSGFGGYNPNADQVRRGFPAEGTRFQSAQYYFSSKGLPPICYSQSIEGGISCRGKHVGAKGKLSFFIERSLIRRIQGRISKERQNVS